MFKYIILIILWCIAGATPAKASDFEITLFAGIGYDAGPNLLNLNGESHEPTRDQWQGILGANVAWRMFDHDFNFMYWHSSETDNAHRSSPGDANQFNLLYSKTFKF